MVVDTIFHLNVEEIKNSKYVIRDTRNNKLVRYSYSVPPLYEDAGKPAAEWQNYYAARLFAQKLVYKEHRAPK